MEKSPAPKNEYRVFGYIDAITYLWLHRQALKLGVKDGTFLRIHLKEQAQAEQKNASGS